MEKAQVLVARAAPWCHITEMYIARALVTATIADMKRQTEAGAQLFALDDEEGAVVGAFLLRVDREAARNVGVVVAAAGGVDEVDLVATMIPMIEKMFYGCDAIRVHTERAGLVRKLGKQGFGVSEIILEKRLGNG